MKTQLYSSIAVLALMAGTAAAEGKITVITSFPESMTGPIEAERALVQPWT